MAIVKIESQQIPLADDIASDDEKLRRVLAPFYPETTNATFARETKDGTLTVTVNKRGGRLGTLAPLAALITAPRTINPAVEFYNRLRGKTFTPEDIVAAREEIFNAIQAGEAEIEDVEMANQRLKKARPLPSSTVPLGF